METKIYSEYGSWDDNRTTKCYSRNTDSINRWGWFVSVTVSMEIEGKTVRQCDQCRMRMISSEDIDGEHIRATLTDSLGDKKDFDLCSEKCLMDMLAKRHEVKKRKKKSKAAYSFNSANRVLEIELPI